MENPIVIVVTEEELKLIRSSLQHRAASIYKTAKTKEEEHRNKVKVSAARYITLLNKIPKR